MTAKPRFKIDSTGPSARLYELSRRALRTGWYTTEGWDFIGYFETIEEARARYEEIKDLPEYLE